MQVFFFSVLFCFVRCLFAARSSHLQVPLEIPMAKFSGRFYWGECRASELGGCNTEEWSSMLLRTIPTARTTIYYIIGTLVEEWVHTYTRVYIYIYIHLYVSTHNALRFSFIQDILWVWAFIYYIIIHIYMYIVCTYIKDKWLLCVVVPAYPYTEEKNRNDFRLCFALFKSVGGSLGSHYLYIIYYNIKHAIKRRRRNPNGKTLTLVVGIRHVCVSPFFLLLFPFISRLFTYTLATPTMRDFSWTKGLDDDHDV